MATQRDHQPPIARALFLSAADSVRAGQDFAFEVALGNRYRRNISLELLAPARGVDSVRRPTAATGTAQHHAPKMRLGPQLRVAEMRRNTHPASY